MCKLNLNVTGAMTHGELLRIPMMQISAGVEQVELLTHTDEGAACLTAYQLEIFFPKEIQISDHMV